MLRLLAILLSAVAPLSAVEMVKSFTVATSAAARSPMDLTVLCEARSDF